MVIRIPWRRDGSIVNIAKVSDTARSYAST